VVISTTPVAAVSDYPHSALKGPRKERSPNYRKRHYTTYRSKEDAPHRVSTGYRRGRIGTTSLLLPQLYVPLVARQDRQRYHRTGRGRIELAPNL
jgi:hypothetical protein